jgi:membrane protease YdiL (CAAX protease family)
MSDPTQHRDDSAPLVMARPITYARPDLDLSYISRADALVHLTFVLLIGLVFPYLVEALIPLEPPDADYTDLGPLLIRQKWLAAVLVGAVLYFFVQRRGMRPASFGLRWERSRRQVLWGLATLGSVYGAVLGSSIIVVALFLLFPSVRSDVAQRVEFVEAMPVQNLGATVALLIAVAIHEEVLFRGLMLPYLRRVLGSWWWAGAISALLFAVLHIPGQGVLGGVQILSIAAVLTVFFILSRSLLAVTLAHFLFDLLQFQLARLAPDMQQVLEELEP